MFRKAKPPRLVVLLLVVAALFFPMYSYFVQGMRFWLVVRGMVTALGMLSIATFILLREATAPGSLDEVAN